MNDSNNIYQKFQERKGQVAVLIDPDKYSDLKKLDELLKKTTFASVDYLFVGGISSIPLWLVTKDPTLSVILITTIDLIAFAPTYRKSYLNPHDEPLYLYSLNVIRHGLSLLAIINVTIATFLFPFMVMLANGSLAVFLLWRRRALKEKTP